MLPWKYRSDSYAVTNSNGFAFADNGDFLTVNDKGQVLRLQSGPSVFTTAGSFEAVMNGHGLGFMDRETQCLVAPIPPRLGCINLSNGQRMMLTLKESQKSKMFCAFSDVHMFVVYERGKWLRVYCRFTLRLVQKWLPIEGLDLHFTAGGLAVNSSEVWLLDTKHKQLVINSHAGKFRRYIQLLCSPSHISLWRDFVFHSHEDVIQIRRTTDFSLVRTLYVADCANINVDTNGTLWISTPKYIHKYLRVSPLYWFLLGTVSTRSSIRRAMSRPLFDPFLLRYLLGYCEKPVTKKRPRSK